MKTKNGIPSSSGSYTLLESDIPELVPDGNDNTGYWVTGEPVAGAVLTETTVFGYHFNEVDTPDTPDTPAPGGG